jgi:hypothetical protein
MIRILTRDGGSAARDARRDSAPRGGALSARAEPASRFVFTRR